MADSALLSDDLLIEIMRHWDGRALGITCQRLSALARPDGYLTVTADAYRCTDTCSTRFTTSRLPDGFLHGVSASDNGRNIYLLTYDCGRLTAVESRCDDSLVYRDILYRGWSISYGANISFSYYCPLPDDRPTQMTTLRSIRKPGWDHSLPGDDVDGAIAYLADKKDGNYCMSLVPCSCTAARFPQIGDCSAKSFVRMVSMRRAAQLLMEIAREHYVNR